MGHLDEAVAELCSPYSGERPGLAIGIAKGDDVVVAAGFGLARMEPPLRAGLDTIGYVGSIAKQFTAACVALAVADGSLRLDDTVRRWIPELPGYAASVTIRHLMHHTSGIPDYLSLAALGATFPGPGDDVPWLVGVLGRHEGLSFPAGTRHLYSNSNYVLLGVAVERATGTPLQSFAATRLFEPAGMASTRFLAGARPHGRRAGRAYRRAGEGEWVLLDPVLGVVGDGGLRSTVDDMLRWCASLRPGGRHDRLAGFLASRGALDDGTELGYAAGLAHARLRGWPALRHGGRLGGWSAEILRLPDEDFAVAVLSHADDCDASVIAHQAAVLALGEPPLPTVEHLGRAPESLTGYWHDRLDGYWMRVRADSEGTVAETEAGRFRVLAASADTVVLDGVDVSLHLRGEDRLEMRAGGEHWRFVERASPWEPADLGGLAGTYASEELGVTWRLDPAEGGLVVTQPIADRPETVLRPTVHDAVRGGGLNLCFSRHDGAVTGFTVDAGRVCGVRFRRVAA